MRIQPLRQPSPNPITFGIYKGHRPTAYGEYTWGEYKGHKIEIFDAKKYNQKLQYVSENNTLRWVWSKLKYIQDGIIKTMRSKAK